VLVAGSGELVGELALHELPGLALDAVVVAVAVEFLLADELLAG